jgi:hypothetical protein
MAPLDCEESGHEGEHAEFMCRKTGMATDDATDISFERCGVMASLIYLAHFSENNCACNSILLNKGVEKIGEAIAGERGQNGNEAGVNDRNPDTSKEKNVARMQIAMNHSVLEYHCIQTLKPREQRFL